MLFLNICDSPWEKREKGERTGMHAMTRHTKGAFHSTKYSGLKFRVFHATNGTARAGMVKWNGIFRFFRFFGILGQPCKVHPKFRNEIPENVCSIRSQTRNFRNFWSNGKRPKCATCLSDMRICNKQNNECHSRYCFAR